MFLKLAKGGESDARKNDHSEGRKRSADDRAKEDHGAEEHRTQEHREEDHRAEEPGAQDRVALAVDGSAPHRVAQSLTCRTPERASARVSPRETGGSVPYRQFVNFSAKLT